MWYPAGYHIPYQAQYQGRIYGKFDNRSILKQIIQLDLNFLTSLPVLYFVSKQSCLIFLIYSLCKNGQDFLDIQEHLIFHNSLLTPQPMGGGRRCRPQCGFLPFTRKIFSHNRKFLTICFAGTSIKTIKKIQFYPLSEYIRDTQFKCN